MLKVKSCVEREENTRKIGNFGVQTIFATGSAPYSVAVGDFNGDNLMDLAVANEGGNTLTILLGYGNGNFVIQLTFVAGSSTWSFVIYDYNNDNHLDVAVGNGNGASVGIFLTKC